jgi:NADP-dependent 3-hydroxy acid dehydrogenase YdfG
MRSGTGSHFRRREGRGMPEVAFITGAGAGFGRALAESFASRVRLFGSLVVIPGKREDALSWRVRRVA